MNESTLRRPKQPHDEGAFMYYVPQYDSPPDIDGAKKGKDYPTVKEKKNTEIG